jgi:hypothetical protein
MIPPFWGAKERVEHLTPAGPDLSRSHQETLDCHIEREVDHHLDPTGAAKVFNDGPWDVHSEGIDEDNRAIATPIQFHV